MANFAGLIRRDWRVTAQSGTSMYHTWYWGPGQHSIRRMTEGFDAGGNPWYELRVAYWHPKTKQVHLFGLTPFSKGVMEGTIKFDGQTADAVFDLYQTGGRRKMGLNWKFDGPDKYREKLLESTGTEGLKLLAEWDHVRTKPTDPELPPVVKEKPKLSTSYKALEPLLGSLWEAKGAPIKGGTQQILSNCKWIPQVDAFHVRVGPDDLDVYLYHHTGTKTHRCLALSSEGTVFEGYLTVLNERGAELELKGYKEDRVVTYAVQFDFQKDGNVRQQVWSLEDKVRTPLLDLLHKRGAKMEK